MKNFWKIVFGSCLGVILASFVVMGIGGLVLGRLAAKAEKGDSVGANTVLVMSFDKDVPELTNNLERPPFDLSEDKVLGLEDIIRSIRAAAEDDHIKGILLDLPLENKLSGRAKSLALRRELEAFKKSGKFVVAYAKYYSGAAYYLASVADKVYMSPMGGVDFRGAGAVLPFFKDLLDRVGIKMEVAYAGDYKSATEPYRFNKMSENNREQLRELIDELYAVYLQDISRSRNIPVQALRGMADSLVFAQSSDYVRSGLIDEAIYRDELLSKLRNRLGLDEDKKIRTITPAAYFKAEGPFRKFNLKKDRIAVVYAEGTIITGEGDPGQIGDDKYVKTLRKLRTNDRVKAVVLRVNSPGGSALASEHILREIQLLREAGKPVIVSMGDYAASGGYYISCQADSIFAEPNTITGSIGVFAMFPVTAEMFNKHLGIHFDTVSTSRYSTSFNGLFPMSEGEKAILQEGVDSIYEIFLNRVATGRNMTRDEVHAIAQGRVWTGTKAVELGLADRLGNLDDAIAAAADMAGLEEYRISEYPGVKSPWEELIEKLQGSGGKELRAEVLKAQWGEMYPVYEQVEEILSTKGPQMRMPFLVLEQGG